MIELLVKVRIVENVLKIQSLVFLLVEMGKKQIMKIVEVVRRIMEEEPSDFHRFLIRNHRSPTGSLHGNAKISLFCYHSCPQSSQRRPHPQQK